MVLGDGGRFQVLQDEQVGRRSLQILHAQALREEGARGAHYRKQVGPQRHFRLARAAA